MRTSRALVVSLILAAVAIVNGCAGLSGSGGPMAPASGASATPGLRPSSPRQAPVEAGSPGTTVPEAWLLVGKRGETGLRLLLAGTGEQVMELPSGTPDSSWHRIVSAEIDATQTTISDNIVQPGLGGPRLTLDGPWRLPTIGLEPVPAGVSLDGSTIALVASKATADPATTATSRFAIVSHVLAGDRSTAPDAALRLERVIELPGAYDYDAISPDGRILYVVEHLPGTPGGRYQVRAIDVATGVMRDAIIADKRNIGEAMAGWPIGQIRRSDGLVLTLYRGAEHPFVHALNTRDAWAVCIDLPAAGASDAAAAREWGLAASPDERNVYAINPRLGLAAEIDPDQLTIRRSATIATASSGAIVLAKFGHTAVGPAGRTVASPDGTTIWTAGSGGITAIRTADLSVARRMLAGTTVDGIASMPDGGTLFALVGGRIVALDPTTGRSLGNVPGDGFDRLLATAPW